MNPKTKKILIIGGSLLVISGVAYYFLKKKKDEQLVGTDTQPVLDTPIVSDVAKPTADASKPLIRVNKPLSKPITSKKPSVPKGIPTGSTQISLVSAVDYLAGTPNGAIDKKLYAKYEKLPIYNALGTKVGTTVKNGYLGVIYTTSILNGNTTLKFVNGNGVKYQIPLSNGLLIRVK